MLAAFRYRTSPWLRGEYFPLLYSRTEIEKATRVRVQFALFKTGDRSRIVVVIDTTTVAHAFLPGWRWIAARSQIQASRASALTRARDMTILVI